MSASKGTGQKENKLDVSGGPPTMDPKKTYINPGDEDQMVIEGYTPSVLWHTVIWVLIVLTLGLLRLLFHWKPEWMLRSTHRKCPLDVAVMVLLLDQYKQWFVHKVKVIDRQHGRKIKTSKSFENIARSGSKLKLLQKSNTQEDDNTWRYFINKKIKYLWHAKEKRYVKLRGLDTKQKCSYFDTCKGLDNDTHNKQLILYNENKIVVKVMPIVKLLFLQVLNPFYMFQVFSCTLWYFDAYYYYASCIVIMSALSISSYIYLTRKAQRKLKQSTTLISHSVVYRNQVWDILSCDMLVPGDVVEIPRDGCIMSCDAVLVSGNCIVNEGMLTGESSPVTKTPIADNDQVEFEMKHHSKSVLFCGTQVIQTRFYADQKVKAVVIRTGFMTAKGELVRSILYPKPIDFKFTHDTYKFVGVLACIAAIGFIYTIVLMVLDEEEAGHIVKRSLDLLTIAVPPALPAALTIVTIFYQSQLRDHHIYCINPSNIPICGSINLVCFDKTGTLTEEGMDVWGFVPSLNSMFNDVMHVVEKMDVGAVPGPGPGPAISCMATCHSLTRIEGTISGDPLDLKMFEATNWELDEPGDLESSRFDMFAPTIVRPSQYSPTDKEAEPPYEIGVVRQFTFSSSLQLMSVITRTLQDDHFCVYSKGAPEKIASLCQPQTVPSNFAVVLPRYTQHGYRVIALAWKPLPTEFTYLKTQKVTRDKLENHLNFLGLLILENQLKEETTAVIDTLTAADIRTVMITGDNVLTAISVARECHIISANEPVITVVANEINGQRSLKFQQTHDIDLQHGQRSLKFQQTHDIDLQLTHFTSLDSELTQVDVEKKKKKKGNQYRFAITGKSWSVIKQYYPEIIPKLAVRGAVFARMSPEQKAQIIEHLQAVGYYVGMCGDGANDCGALKMAHAGISLSEAEASLASPFTSTKQNIECVPTVMRHGRAGLTTTFGIFKFMACYSLTQFISVTLLYWIGSNLTDFQFLYVDLILLTTLSITFSRTRPYDVLVKKPAAVSLLAVQPILSITLQVIIQAVFQVLVFMTIKKQPWFEPFVDNPDDYYWSHENTAVYYVSSFQYITLAVVFSKGAPYRKTLFTNWLFLSNLVIVTLLNVYISIYPPDWINDLLEIRDLPSILYRIILIVASLSNFIISLIIESFVVDNDRLQDFVKQCLKVCCPRNTQAQTSKAEAAYEYIKIENDLNNLQHWPHNLVASDLADPGPDPDLSGMCAVSVPDDTSGGGYSQHMLLAEHKSHDEENEKAYNTLHDSPQTTHL